jgi:hypothetical protein
VVSNDCTETKNVHLFIRDLMPDSYRPSQNVGSSGDSGGVFGGCANKLDGALAKIHVGICTKVNMEFSWWCTPQNTDPSGHCYSSQATPDLDYMIPYTPGEVTIGLYDMDEGGCKSSQEYESEDGDPVPAEIITTYNDFLGGFEGTVVHEQLGVPCEEVESFTFNWMNDDLDAGKMQIAGTDVCSRCSDSQALPVPLCDFADNWDKEEGCKGADWFGEQNIKYSHKCIAFVEEKTDEKCDEKAASAQFCTPVGWKCAWQGGSCKEDLDDYDYRRPRNCDPVSDPNCLIGGVAYIGNNPQYVFTSPNRNVKGSGMCTEVNLMKTSRQGTSSTDWMKGVGANTGASQTCLMTFAGNSRGSGCDNPTCAYGLSEIEEGIDDYSARACGIEDTNAYNKCVDDPEGDFSPLKNLGPVQQARAMGITYKDKQKFHLSWTPSYGTFSVMEYSHCPWIDDPSQPVLPQFGRNVYIGAVRTELKKRGCTCIEDQGEYVNRECTYTDSNNDGKVDTDDECN